VTGAQINSKYIANTPANTLESIGVVLNTSAVSNVAKSKFLKNLSKFAKMWGQDIPSGIPLPDLKNGCPSGDITSFLVRQTFPGGQNPD